MCRMGHGDELVLADAHFPGESLGPRVIRADGLRVADLLDAILPLYALDTYVAHPIAMMDSVPGDVLDPQVEASYRQAIDRHALRHAHCPHGAVRFLRPGPAGLRHRHDRRDGEVREHHLEERRQLVAAAFVDR